MKRLFCVTIILIALIGTGYVGWLKHAYPPEQTCRECPEPIPRIDDHVADVMAHEADRCETQLTQCLSRETQHVSDCPTWDTLKRAGVEIVCADAFGPVPAVNYWPVKVGMACNRIKRIIITGKQIMVERR